MLYLLLTSSAAIIYVIGGVFMAQRGLLALVAVYLCFFVGASFQLFATRSASNMSLTYLITLGLEATLSVGLGFALLGERYTQAQLFGIGLVIAGIALLRR